MNRGGEGEVAPVLNYKEQQHGNVWGSGGIAPPVVPRERAPGTLWDTRLVGTKAGPDAV
jgi:hypothetical protein